MAAFVVFYPLLFTYSSCFTDVSYSYRFVNHGWRDEPLEGRRIVILPTIYKIILASRIDTLIIPIFQLMYYH